MVFNVIWPGLEVLLSRDAYKLSELVASPCLDLKRWATWWVKSVAAVLVPITWWSLDLGHSSHYSLPVS